MYFSDLSGVPFTLLDHLFQQLLPCSKLCQQRIQPLHMSWSCDQHTDRVNTSPRWEFMDLFPGCRESLLLWQSFAIGYSLEQADIGYFLIATVTATARVHSLFSLLILCHQLNKLTNLTLLPHPFNFQSFCSVECVLSGSCLHQPVSSWHHLNAT